MRHASTGQRTTTTGERYRGRLVLIGLLSLSLVAAGTSSLASGPTDAPTDLATVEAAEVHSGGTDRSLTAPATADTEAPAVGEAPALEEAPATPEPTAEATQPAEDAPATPEPNSTPVDGANDVAVDGVDDETDATEPAAPSTDVPAPETPEPAQVAPMAVPRPTENEAVITVKVGGDRTGGGVSGVDGVKLRLHDGNANGPSNPVDEDWAECVSDSAGDCNFEVPDTSRPVVERGECIVWFLWCWEYEEIQLSGFNYDRQFWVVQEAGPSGWYTNPSLVTGGAGSQQSTAYRFRTGTMLRAGSTYTAGTHFMTGSGNSTRAASSGRWQVSRANPQLPQTCEAGIDVALVLDLSGSVDTANAVGDLKASAIAFAEALEGTDSRLALFTFASTAPRNSGATGRNYPDLLPIDGNLSTIRSRINGYAAEGGTNWDRGIAQVAENAQNFDLAIVITDGQATYSGTPYNGPGNFTRFVETEHAIFSANALKAEGTRVLAVGVGDGISGDAANLRAVSGPNGHTSGASANSADYFQTGWRELAPLLENLAKGATCQSTITVDKVVEPYAGEARPGEGWTFAANRTAGEGVVTPDGPQVTGASGSVGYTVRFDRPDAAAATVRIEERVTAAQRAEGWSLTDVSCTVNGERGATSRDGDSVVLSGITAGDDVACTFTNTQTLEPRIEIDKRGWNVTSADDLDGAAELISGSSVKNGTTITWTYTVRNTGQTELLDIVVADDQGVVVTCPKTKLDAGQHMVCTGSGPVAPTRP